MFWRKKREAKRAADRLNLSWKRKLWVDYVKPIGSAILIALLIRQFVIQAFRIPTGSMEKTLLVGDFLFVNKFLYGAKTPARVRIPLVNWTLIDKLPVLKFPAVREPRQGDIIVFEYPLDRNLDYIKRCVAVAGDTVELREGRLHVNGRVYEDDLNHPDRDTSLRGPDERIKPHTNHEPSQAGRQLNREYRLAEALASRTITPRRFVAMIESALARDVGLDPTVVAPHLDPLRAHVDGTETLSAVAMRPHLGALMTHARDTQAPLVVPEGMIFMMGDNRYNSADSRFWGPLDVDLIRGKALFIYWSWDKERTLPRFERLLDLIH